MPLPENSQVEVLTAGPEAIVDEAKVDYTDLQQALPKEGTPQEVKEIMASHDLIEEGGVDSTVADYEQDKVTPIELSVDKQQAEPVRLISAELGDVMYIPELPAPIDEIETAFLQLSESLISVEPEKSQAVYQILEQIIELPASLKTATYESTVKLEEKLEELFIELFDAVDIAWTPELIKSFIKLTQSHYLEELLEPPKEAEMQGLPDEIGTREFLQKLQHGLSSMKQAAVYLYEIGKSALRLYGLSRSVPLIS